MKTEVEILDAAVRISEARFRNESIAIIRAYRGRVRELEERNDNLIEAMEDAEEYIEELEEAAQ